MGWIATWHRIMKYPMNLIRWQSFIGNNGGFW
jgi:hypothetical protein